MPSYSYHLKLELYPTPDPTARASLGADNRDPVWVPSRDSSIFDNLPAHSRQRQQSPWRPQLRSQPHYREEAIEFPPEDYRVPTGNLASGVIDCGASQSTAYDGEHGNTVLLSERQWRARSKSFPPPTFAAGIGPRTAAKDWRFGRVNIESFDLVETPQRTESAGKGSTASMAEQAAPVHATPAASLGPNLGGVGQATKGRYVGLDTKNTEAGWGIVHLYREGDEPHEFGEPPEPDRVMEGASGSASTSSSSSDEEGTILCIPAVPSYLTPSDFLGFVGEKWRGDVSHYRMVMTSKMNRYMVLMKFKDKWRANDWRKEFDGKSFNSMGSEICHVTFLKSITVETPGQTNPKSPESKADPFASASSGVVSSLKPFPPPTPDLIELPTCPVCLERMDDTTGLMTILCQHVFHCTCLQTWKGSGCPVCRATNPAPQADGYDASNPYSQPFGHGVSNLCSVCDSSEDLWICLICGNVGCGRYKGGHAKDHWKETAHSFSLELETQHVWDYAGDMWVHRLIRDKGDGKVFELPSNDHNNPRHAGGSTQDEDVVPRAKLDHIGIEYTHLLTSQLESQRIYFEDMVNKAVDKAAKASAAAELATAQAERALRELATLQAGHRALKENTVASLEKDLAREGSRAAKSTDLARSLGKALQEEKQVTEGLMKRIEHVNKELEEMRGSMDALRVENEELKETNRDLTMFISGQEKLKELENEGKVGQSELEEGTLSLPEEKRRKGKGKGKR